MEVVLDVDGRSVLRCVAVAAACFAVLRSIVPYIALLGGNELIVDPVDKVAAPRSSGAAFGAAAVSAVRAAGASVVSTWGQQTGGGILDLADEFAILILNPFVLYAAFLLLVAATTEILRASFENASMDVEPQHWIWFCSAAAEGIGLVFLRSRIHQAKRVAGISCSAVGLYALMYAWRASVFPELCAMSLYAWSLKTIECASCCLIFDVIRSILVTYRETYQEELDIVQVRHVVGLCFLLTLAFSPDRGVDIPSTRPFTMQMYVDSLALLPQVVFMARQDCPVPAPIAHFVVAMAFSRMLDLFYWTQEYALWEDASAVSFSGWVVMSLHVLNLLIAGDFLYYWVKAGMAGRGFDEDILIPSAFEP